MKPRRAWILMVVVLALAVLLAALIESIWYPETERAAPQAGEQSVPAADLQDRFSQPKQSEESKSHIPVPPDCVVGGALAPNESGDDGPVSHGFDKIDWFNAVDILDASSDPEHKVAAALLTQIVTNKQVRQLLVDSPDPEHLIADSLLTQISGAEQLEVERYKAALAANPNDPMTLNLLYASCGYQLSFDWCREQNVEQRLIEADGNNGATWGMIANMRTFIGDRDGALEALQRASTSTRMHTYNPEHVALLERSLAAAGAGSYSTRAVAAIGAAFVVTHPAGDLFQACEVLSPQDHRWRTHCLEFGQAIERQASGEVDYQFGIMLQKNVLNTVGDTAELVELGRRAAERAPRRLDRDAGDFGTAFWTNDALVGEFVNALVNVDEFTAQEIYNREQEAWAEERCGADRPQ